MSSIDQRVVEMKFKNSDFQSGVASTMKSLDELKSKLNFDSAKKGLNDLSAAGKNFSLEGMAHGIENISSKFSALNIVGVTALVNIANQAITAGEQLVKSLTIAPIKAGFDEYELKLGSIQTILANTAKYGTKLSDVNGALDNLNTYADKTIYSFSEMTKSIGLFTNSGLKLKDSVSIVKGFANASAVSGVTAEAAAHASVQLSQALSAGTVRAIDWFSLTNAGLGNQNMKDSLIDIALATGKVQKGTKLATEIQTNFKGSLEKGWLSADIMSSYLKIMAGDMTDAEQAALGLSKAQIAAFKVQQQTAEDAATKVRTFSQLISTLREAVGSGWAQTFETIFGNFYEATDLFTNINDVISGFISRSAEARNKVLDDWKAMHGRTILIYAIKNAFNAVMAIIKPIKDAFREIFPAKTGKDLVTMSVWLRHITGHMIIGKDTADKLKRTFEGVFSVFKIGAMIVGGIARAFFSLFSVAGKGTGGILALTATVADMITALAKWLQSSGAIGSIFDGLIAVRTTILMPTIKFIVLLADAISSLVSGDITGFGDKFGKAFSSIGDIIGALHNRLMTTVTYLQHVFTIGSNGLTAFAKAVQNSGNEVLQTLGHIATDIADFLSGTGQTVLGSITGVFKDFSDTVEKMRALLNFKISAPSLDGVDSSSLSFIKLSAIGASLKSVWDGIIGVFSGIGSGLSPIVSNIGKIFETLTGKLNDFMKDFDFQDALALVNTGAFIAMYLTIKGVAKSFGKMLTSISGTFSQLTSSLKTMQTSVRVKIILTIAIAIGILAGALLVLSKIPAAQLKNALIALTGLFLQLAATIVVITKFAEGGVKKAAAAALTMVALSVSVLILAEALKAISSLSWEEMAKGLVGVGVLLGGLLLFTKFAKLEDGGVKTGIGLVLLAAGIKLLVESVKTLGEMKVDVLKQGLISLGLMIATLALVVKAINGVKGIPAAAAGLLILAFALLEMVGVMKIFAMIDPKTFAKGLERIAITIAALAVALNLMPYDMPAIALGLIVISGALLLMARALKQVGEMDLWSLIKAVGALGILLGILVLSVIGMEAAAPGAGAMVLVAGALLVLAEALKLIGEMDLWSIIKGLIGLTGVFIILALAALGFTAIAPAMAILVTVIDGLGLGMLLAGAGFALFAGALALLAISGAAGVAVLIAAFTAFLGMIPLWADQIGLGLIAIIKVIGKVTPRIIDEAGKIVLKIAAKLVELVPKLEDAGLKMLFGVLNAIKENTFEITSVVLQIIAAFNAAVTANLSPLIRAGIEFLTAFMNGIADAIENGELGHLIEAGIRIGKALAEGMAKGLAKAAPGLLKSASKALVAGPLGVITGPLGWAVNSPSKVTMGLGKSIGEGFVIGVNNHSGQVNDSMNTLGSNALQTLKDSVSGFSDIINGNMDLNPTLTPVLDLTDLQKNAGKMGALLGANGMSVSAAYSTANSAASGYQSNQTASDTFASKSVGNELTFIQNNNSPKALSSAEIYRQTNNQLSQVKGALALSAK